MGREERSVRKAGYILRDGWKVLDREGIPREVLALHIHGATLGMCLDTLCRSLREGSAVPVERVKKNWMPYLAGLAGTATVSRSGKALNIELVNSDRFTLSLDALYGVINRTERYASVAELPRSAAEPAPRNRLITDYASTLSRYSSGAPDGLTA
jgi:hypothetical protein